ncbi:ComEC/Rec2 family competence protein [Alkalihalobacillus pseudalcaliphilus]|uniref:ComEC/Rec2 family competence protein n=1 Tax=Alkalihalobacillus pseudalcaliphilus TaxID=79884 RepID=UPI00064DAD8D|nr:MBL fold metallo-hydrolase [Alkalihalobacillus pseudalcaliphilus]KMK78160.1 hypothetical protein AB990_01605 [Alkalihalobacillus pseudalcaliphilus]
MENVTRTHLIKLFIFIAILITGFYISTQDQSKVFVLEADASMDQPISFFRSQEDQEALTIRYFNLNDKEKSGDSILIKSPEGKTLLIDAGNVKMGEQLNELLEQLRVETLDYAIATHPHHDHIGGFFSVIGTIPISQFLMPDIPVVSKLNQAFHQLLAKRQIHIDYLQKGDSFKLGKEVVIEVLNPSEIPEKQRWTTKQINQLALVLKITYQNTTFLLASDIYKQTESKLIEEFGEQLHVDLLHIPHHGHKTSSSSAFLNTVNPEYAIISSNTSKWKKVYKRLVDKGINTLVTEKNGHIYIQSNGQQINISPEIK